MSLSRRHNHPLTRLGLWLASELLLGLLGMDDAADAGEWVFEREQRWATVVEQIQ